MKKVILSIMLLVAITGCKNVPEEHILICKGKLETARGNDVEIKPFLFSLIFSEKKYYFDGDFKFSGDFSRICDKEKSATCVFKEENSLDLIVNGPRVHEQIEVNYKIGIYRYSRDIEHRNPMISSFAQSTGTCQIKKSA
jgi:hypothetical protein